MADRNKKSPSIAGLFLKNYRRLHNNMTQEELAEILEIEPRTLRAYENGERQLNTIQDLHHIASVLGIEPERLGIAASVYVPKTPKQIEETVARVWSLMHELRINEANIIINSLMQDISCLTTIEEPSMLQAIAHAYHGAGYVASMSARTSEVPKAIHSYHQMEGIARIINNQTLLNTALAYQGDMYRRIGETEKALMYLEAARDLTPLADPAARGNSIQLLGRAYLPVGNIKGFEHAMAQAEELGHQIDAQANSIQGHYNLGTVYEEYAKSYAALGQTQKALDYVDLTEDTLPKTKNNEVLLTIVRSEALIYGGEIESGKPLAIEAARLSRVQGHQRRLERIYKIIQYLHQQSLKLSKAEMDLSEALEGPFERWDINV